MQTDYLAAALSWLDGPSNNTTRLTLFGWAECSVVTQTETLTQSIFQLAFRWEAKILECLSTGPLTEAYTN